MMSHRFRQWTTALPLFLAVHAPATVLYVDLNCTNPTPPYTNWISAATNIQDAVDAAVAGDRVLVTNGVYRTGSANGGTCRVMLNSAITLASVNGPQPTTILGSSWVKCVYAYNSGAALNGFTLTGSGYGGVQCNSGAVVTTCIIRGNTNGVSGGTIFNCLIAQNYTAGEGAGARNATLYNCILSNNVAVGDGGGAYACTLYNCRLVANRSRYGGGASGGTLLNCVLDGNSATGSGGYDGGFSGILSNCTVTGNSANLSAGGVSGGTVYNCLITSNSAASGGGVYVGNNRLYNCTICANTATNSGGGLGMYYSGGNATLVNCIIYGNSANSNANWESYGGGYYDNYYDHCCTTPEPKQSFFCITNAPGFVDWPSGNFRLQTSSPCINAGENWELPLTNDLDGRARIAGGTVDMGAYEFQGSGMGEFIGWLQHYGLPTDGSADYTYTDLDDMNNWQEWIGGTEPTNRLSVLQMLAPSNGLSGVSVSWQSVSGKTYFLQRGTDLLLQPGLSAFQSNVVGQAGITSITDTTATNAGPYFYRIGVQ